MAVVARSEVWWCDFGTPLGSEPGHLRPAVVVSSDRFNRSRIATIIITAITSNLRLGSAPGNVELEAGEAGLGRASVINVSQSMVVDRSRMAEYSGTLSPHVMRAVDDGLRLVLDL